MAVPLFNTSMMYSLVNRARFLLRQDSNQSWMEIRGQLVSMPRKTSTNSLIPLRQGAHRLLRETPDKTERVLVMTCYHCGKIFRPGPGVAAIARLY